MAAPGCKITAMAVFVSVLALIHYPADALYIVAGWSSLSSCTGVVTTCLDIPLGGCCLMDRGVHSVRFDGLEILDWGNIFHVDFCSNPVLAAKKGPGPLCMRALYFEGIIQSARVARSFERPLPTSKDNVGLAESDDARGCNSTMVPNAVAYYTSDEVWVLKPNSDKVKTVREHVESLPEDQQLAWMKDAGAELHSSLGKMEIHDVGAGME